jgi:hypothetical protein
LDVQETEAQNCVTGYTTLCEFRPHSGDLGIQAIFKLDTMGKPSMDSNCNIELHLS